MGIGPRGVTSLFGTKEQVGVSRGVAEFQARRPVLIGGDDEILLALPVEGLDSQRLAEFSRFCSPVPPHLVVTARRALALGLDAATPVALRLPAGFDLDLILSLVTNIEVDCKLDHSAAGSAALAAIHLVKLSQGLPAVLVANISATNPLVSEQQIIAVEQKAVMRFRDDMIRSLAIAS